MKKIIVVGISGASGVKYSIDFCLLLKKLDYVPIAVITDGAETVAELENKIILSDTLKQLRIQYYREEDIGVSIASGSFKTDGMVIYPTSINTLSKVAHSINDNLLIRAADVTLKEKRKLILVVRETPFHVGHLKLMKKVCETGAVVMPLIFSFYQKKEDLTLQDCFRQFNGRVLDQLNIDNDLVNRWTN